MGSARLFLRKMPNKVAPQKQTWLGGNSFFLSHSLSLSLSLSLSPSFYRIPPERFRVFHFYLQESCLVYQLSLWEMESVIRVQILDETAFHFLLLSFEKA